jgi:hypothetical protein
MLTALQGQMCFAKTLAVSWISIEADSGFCLTGNSNVGNSNVTSTYWGILA